MIFAFFSLPKSSHGLFADGYNRIWSRDIETKLLCTPIPSALEKNTSPLLWVLVLVDKEVNKSSALRSTTFELPSNDTRRAVARWFSFWSTRVWPVCYLTGIPGPRRLELLLVAS